MSKVSFYNISFDERPKKSLSFVKRENILCILRNPRNDTFAILKWKNIWWKSFIGGGIEEKESLEVAAIREIKEETGYKNLKYIGKICEKYEYKVYVSHKKQNRWAIVSGVSLELISDKKNKISDVENNNYEVMWIKRDEVEDFLNIVEHKYLWYKYNGWKWNYNEGDIVDKRVKYNLIAELMQFSI